MKLSCLPVSLFGEIQSGRMSIREWAEGAKKIGYDGIDLSMLMISSHTQTYVDALKSQLDASDIPVVMATTYPDFTHPDKLYRARELAYLMRDIALCDALGIGYLRVLAGQKHECVSIEDGVAYSIENLVKADVFAKDYNIKLVFENHAKPGAWDNVDFSYPLDIFYKVFDGLKDTAIRLNFDIGNIVSQGKDPMEVLERVLDRVETVHISDMKEYGNFCPVQIGTGVCPIPEVIERLKKAEFDGWFSIEEASGQGLDGIAKAYEYVRPLLERN